MMSNDQTKSIMETLRRMKYINYWSLIPGMTPAEISLLAAVCDGSAERKKVSDLYGVCAMQPTAVSRLMNSLEEKGLIERNVRKGNRRITGVLAADLNLTAIHRIPELILVPRTGDKDPAKLLPSFFINRFCQ